MTTVAEAAANFCPACPACWRTGRGEAGQREIIAQKNIERQRSITGQQ